MKKFELLLKNEKIRSYDRIATLIILINLALFILLAINAADKKIRITSLAGASLLLIILLLLIIFLLLLFLLFLILLLLLLLIIFLLLFCYYLK